MRRHNQNYIQKQLSYKINFYAVGQGLFSSGHITLDNDKYSQRVYLEKEMVREISKGITEVLEDELSRHIAHSNPNLNHKAIIQTNHRKKSQSLNKTIPVFNNLTSNILNLIEM